MSRDAAGAAQRSRDRGLHGLRRAVIDQARGNHVRHHAMLDQDDQQRVEHPRLVRRRQAAAQHQRRHVRERDFADEFLVQVVAAHENATELGFAEPGDDLWLFSHGKLL